MKVARAMVAGLIGGVVAVIVLCVGAWLFDAGSDVCALFGVMLARGTGPASWVIGCVFQLVAAAIVGVVYAAVFEWVTRRAGAAIGVLAAIPHLIIAGVAMGFVPLGLDGGGVAQPGAFLEYGGVIAIVMFVVAHLAYGVIVGVTYGRPRHVVADARGVVWQDVSEAPR